jgi:hypothetical protein
MNVSEPDGDFARAMNEPDDSKPDDSDTDSDSHEEANRISTFYTGIYGWAYHTETASLFIRIPKDANNALRLMLYAQFAGENETNQQVLKYWGDGRETRQADLLYIGEKMRKKQEELLRPLLVRHPCSHHHHPAM